MKPKMRALTTTLMLTTLAATTSIHAGTKLQDGKWKEFTAQTATQDMSVRPDSFYNLTMGYQGWTHHSNWGFAKLKKGKPVTITATATSTDEAKKAAMHPGIAVFYVPQGKKYADKLYNYDHFYSQWKSVSLKDISDDDTEDTTDIIKGMMVWTFITNGFDRDGMEDALSGVYDQSHVYRLLDGVPGTVSVTFTPPASGWYKFAVGGINPGAGLRNETGILPEFQPVSVTVDFPE